MQSELQINNRKVENELNMKPLSEIISSNSGKMTPFIKRLFTSSSPCDYLFLYFCNCKVTFCLRASTQYQHLTTSKWTHPERVKKDRTSTARFSKKVNDDLMKTTSWYNGTDRWVTILFDEIKLKENLTLLNTGSLAGFIDLRDWHKYLQLSKERRYRYTWIGVLCQGCFFKFKVQLIDVFRTKSNIYDGAL